MPKACTTLDILEAVSKLPFDRFGVLSKQELEDFAQATKTSTEKGRGLLANMLGTSGLGGKIASAIEGKFRLTDTPLTHILNYYSDKRQLGPSYGAVADDEIQHLINRGKKDNTLHVEEVQHEGVPGQGRVLSQVVRDPNLIAEAKQVASLHPEFGIMDDGQLHLSDLMQYVYHFHPTPEQFSLLSAMNAPMKNHLELEAAFGIATEDNSNGFNIHRENIQQHILREDGRVVESNRGPVVAGRPGATQSFSKDEGVPSMSAGYKAGNKYLPFSQAQSARISQGYHTMADRYLDGLIDSIGKTGAELLPSQLVHDFEVAKKVSGQLDDIRKRLVQAYKVADSTHGWQVPKYAPVHSDIANLLDDARIASQQATPKLRRQMYDEVRQRVEAQSTTASADLTGFKEARAKNLKLIQDNPNMRGDNPIEFRGKYYTYDTGNELKGLNEVDIPNGISAAVNNVNEAVRPIMATLDASFLGVQGLVAALSHPTNYFKAMGTVFSNGYGDYEESLKNSGRLDAMIRDGVHWTAKNDFSDFLFPSAVRKIPVVGGLANVSNEWFARFGNVLRGELYNAGFNPVTMAGDTIEATKARKSLARTVNLTTGFTPNNPTSIERTLEFAPRYFRSTLGLLADAATKGDLSTMGAARTIGTAITSGVALTYAINAAQGEKTVFDPADPNFLRIRFNGNDYSIFGTWDTLARAITKSATDGPIEGAAYLARVKASPVLGKVFDLIQGSTLSGDSLNWSSPTDVIMSAGKMAGSSVVPISLQNVAQQPPTSPLDLVGTATQFMGVKSTPLSPGERRDIKRESLAQSEYHKPWGQLEPYQQSRLRSQFDAEPAPTSEIGKAFEFHRGISERFNVDQQRIDSSLPAGDAWRQAYHDLTRERTGAFQQWTQEHPEAVAAIRGAKPTNANEAARQQMYQVFDQADRENWTPEETSNAFEAFQTKLSPEQNDYIQRNTGLKDTPRVKEYKAAQKVLKPYWDLADQVWERLSPRLPADIQASSLQDYQDKLVQRLQDAGIPDQVILMRVQQNPVMKEIDRATTELRKRYRDSHPEAKKELIKWYGYSPTG